VTEGAGRATSEGKQIGVSRGTALAVSGNAGQRGTVQFEREAADRQRRHADQPRRLLVIADSRCRPSSLRDAILTHLDGTGAVHLIVPVRVSHLHFLTDDEGDELQESWQSVRRTVGLLEQTGIAITGSVGSDKPLESMIDALASFPANRVLLATPPEDASYWLERDLLPKARRLTEVPVAQLIVPTTTTVGQPRRVIR
jgi:hypothetical protein